MAASFEGQNQWRKRFLSSLLPIALANLTKISQQVQILGGDREAARQGNCARLIHCLRSQEIRRGLVTT